jgi:hypothetical protein
MKEIHIVRRDSTDPHTGRIVLTADCGVELGSRTRRIVSTLPDLLKLRDVGEKVCQNCRGA